MRRPFRGRNNATMAAADDPDYAWLASISANIAKTMHDASHRGPPARAHIAAPAPAVIIRPSFDRFRSIRDRTMPKSAQN